MEFCLRCGRGLYFQWGFAGQCPAVEQTKHRTSGAFVFKIRYGSQVCECRNAKRQFCAFGPTCGN